MRIELRLRIESASKWRDRTFKMHAECRTRKGTDMKFMMMMSFKNDAESAAKGIMTWPKEDVKAHIGFMMSFNKEMKESGEFVAAEGLAWPTEAKVVRAGANGTPITDG